MFRSKRIRQILYRIVERLAKEYQPQEIILYGSYAYGKPTRDSDIDLVIVKDTDTPVEYPKEEIAAIMEEVKEVARKIEQVVG